MNRLSLVASSLLLLGTLACNKNAPLQDEVNQLRSEKSSLLNELASYRSGNVVNLLVNGQAHAGVEVGLNGKIIWTSEVQGDTIQIDFGTAKPCDKQADPIFPAQPQRKVECDIKPEYADAPLPYNVIVYHPGISDRIVDCQGCSTGTGKGGGNSTTPPPPPHHTAQRAHASTAIHGSDGIDFTCQNGQPDLGADGAFKVSKKAQPLVTWVLYGPATDRSWAVSFTASDSPCKGTSTVAAPRGCSLVNTGTFSYNIKANACGGGVQTGQLVVLP